jgi:hypothetical protein
MTSRDSFRAAVSLVSVAFVLNTACAGFRGGELPETQPWPPSFAAAKKKTVSLVLSPKSSSVVNGQTIDPPPNMMTKWREFTEETYKDSQLFSAVLGESLPADLRAEVRVTDEGNFSRAAAVFSGLTLTLIPANAVDHFTLHTDFKNAQGQVLASIEKKDSMSTWIELFLIFVLPFKSPASVSESVFHELNRATLAEAHAKGIL